MKCPSSERQLLASLERLTPAEGQEIAQHTRSCLLCLRRARQNEQLVRVLATPPPYACSNEELTQRILRARDDTGTADVSTPSSGDCDPGAAARVSHRGVPSMMVPSMMMAAAVVLASFGAGTFLQSNSPAPTSAQRAHEHGAPARAAESLLAAAPRRDQAPDSGALRIAADLERRATQHVLLAQYEQAEQLYERSLAIKEHALGTDAASVAELLDDLGALYLRQSRYVQAEPLFRRSLAIKAKRLGPQHPEVTSALDALAVLLSLTTQA